MTNAILNRLSLVILLLTTQVMLAQPTGQEAFHFTTNDVPLWDISGGYTLNTPMKGAGGEVLPLVYSVFIEHLPSGALRGEGTTLVRIGQDTVAGFYVVRGSVSGGGDLTRANFTVTLRGIGVISGANRNFSISTSYRLEVDATALALDGRVSGRASFSHLGQTSMKDDALTLPLPAGVDGSWFITMSFLPLGSFAGTANISVSSLVPIDNPPGFPTARLLPAKVRGSYSYSHDLTSMSISGIYEARGVSLSLKLGPDDTLQRLSGRALGQTLRH